MPASLVPTRWSMVLAAGGEDAAAREALAWLCRQYWDTLAAHVRRRGWREDQELAQDFLADLIERGSLRQADRGRGRFRTWLLCCLDHFLANRAASARAARRGGGRPHADLDQVAAVAVDPTAAFDRDWALAVLRAAEAALASEATDARRFAVLRAFLRREGGAGAYGDAAAELGLSETALRVAVHRLRQRFRELIRLGIAETLAEPDPASIDAELDILIAALTRPG